MTSVRPAILVCTVGGSPEPIVTAIRTIRPVHVAFLCTAKGTDGPGSDDQVASILAACAPSNASHEIRLVAADDPDAAFVVARETLLDLHRRFPDAELRADYTGGTKSMTAALMLAATATPETGAVVQFMAGQRKDLVRIVGGTERPVRMSLEGVIADRALERARGAWRSFGWSEALAILPPTTAGLPAPLAREIEELRAASELFAAWDRFEHPRALELLDAAALPKLERWRPALRRLASAEPHEREPLALYDLWLNAQRRATRGQHDDAVARAYRLVEWSAQDVLRTELGIQTAGVTRAQLGDALFDHLDRASGREKLKLGLEQSLDVVRIKCPDHALTAMLGPKALPVRGKSPKGAATRYLTRLVDPSQGWKERRNRSILAHGDRPVGEDVWQTAAAWCRERWIPWLEDELRRHGQALVPLPDHWPLA